MILSWPNVTISRLWLSIGVGGFAILISLKSLWICMCSAVRLSSGLSLVSHTWLASRMGLRKETSNAITRLTCIWIWRHSYSKFEHKWCSLLPTTFILQVTINSERTGTGPLGPLFSVHQELGAARRHKRQKWRFTSLCCSSLDRVGVPPKLPRQISRPNKTVQT